MEKEIADEEVKAVYANSDTASQLGEKKESENLALDLNKNLGILKWRSCVAKDLSGNKNTMLVVFLHRA